MSDLQFKAYIPTWKPKLAAAMKVKRLNWARDLKDKNLDFWKLVIICKNVVVFIFYFLQNTGQMSVNVYKLYFRL